MNIAEIFFQFSDAREEFEEQLVQLVGEQFEDIGWDDYDCSLELYKCSPDLRLSLEAFQFIQSAGFSKIYVNHTDGWETHYNPHSDVSKPWRRKRREDGGFDINFMPQSWESVARKDLDRGYIRVVPE